MSANSETKTDSPDETLSLRLRTLLHRLPDAERRRTMEEATRRSISLGLTSRGDPFGRDEVIILSSVSASIRIPLDRLPVTLGRGKEADFAVLDPRASKLHCRIERDGLFVRINDLGAKNGTLLNGRRIGATHLREGDRIGIGAIEFVVTRG